MCRRALWILAWMSLSAGAITHAGELSLSRPQGLCYDAKGRLYVADTGNHRVLVFDSNLKLVGTVGADKPGDGSGQLNEPMDVAVDSAGRIVVADSRNYRVQVFSADLQYLFQFGKQGTGEGEFALPTNVTVDDHDHLIVTDRSNHRLQVFDRDGKHVFTLSNRTGAKTPNELQAFKDYALRRNQKPEEVNSQWQITDWGQLNEPGAVFFDAMLKRLFVANGWNCRIEILDYDSSAGVISRRDFHSGIAWGFWINRGCVGDDTGRLYGVQSAWGTIRIFPDRNQLDQDSNPTIDINPGAYGTVKELNDLAVSPVTGDVAITDAFNSRVIVYDKDFTMPDAPRVSTVASTRASISWQTTRNCGTRIQLRKGEYPFNTPNHLANWNDSNVIEKRFGKAESTQHVAPLSGLDPATRYYYRLWMPEMRVIPGGGWSREYSINTSASRGRTAFLRIPVKVLLVANVINTESLLKDPGNAATGLQEGVTFPEPMSDEDIKRYYENQWKETQLFYWNNSSMRYWIDYDLYIDRDFYRKGLLPEATPDTFKQLKEQNHDASFQRLIHDAGRDDKIYVGQVICEAEQRWDAGKRAWVFSGSGGGTYGVEWPVPGRTHFLGGSDVAWLFCHEFKHQVESQYGNSGLDREDDRMWFCHLSPKYDNPDPKIGKWQWDTAADHGEHWDGIAWQLRHFTASQYMRNLYGHLETSTDRDEDGIPDDDPRLPFDEKRFHSNPTQKDTDGDGLTDMQEILAPRWHTALLTDVRRRVSPGYIRPDPRNPDSDGDGLRDGVDPYPIYPFKSTIPLATITVDGNLSDWTAKQHLYLKPEKLPVKVDVYCCHDSRWLYYGLKVVGQHGGLTLVTDNHADGFYVGNDNVYLEIKGDGTLRNVRMHLASNNRWPYFDDRHEVLKPEDVPFASKSDGSGQTIELAIPAREDIGLSVQRGKRTGLMLYISLPDTGPISLFEPYVIFDSTLQ